MEDPYLKPTFNFLNRLRRFCWGVAWVGMCSWTPRPFHIWRVFVLRIFGASIGERCAIYPNVKIWAPWNLTCEDAVAVAEGVEIYNPKPVVLGSHSILSQGAYICGATHDHNSPEFTFIAKEVHVGRYAWICARAVVMPGVRIGDGAVLALGAVATKDLLCGGVYGGIPARHIGAREGVWQ